MSGVTSTPMRRPDFHRRSLLNSAAITSNIGSPIVLLNRTDDEAERSFRRESISIQRRLSNIPDSSKVSSSFQEIPGLIEKDQIENHLKICTKLFVENRITIKNAWELHVIDIIRKIASSSGAQDVLKMAGSSLEIGAKVYGLRVDDLHQRGMKLASTLTATKENEASDGDNNEDQTNKGEDDNRTKKKKKIGCVKKNAIDKEGNSLFTPLSDLAGSDQFSTKENIEVCSTKNLFTEKLRIKPTTGHLVHMSNDRFWTNDEDKDLLLENTNEVISSCEYFPVLKKENLCATFKDFEIVGDWDPTKDDVFGSASTDAVLDDEGFPIPELDGSIPDIFENNHHNDDEGLISEEDEHCDPLLHGEVEHVINAIPEESRMENDYGYNPYVQLGTGKYIDRIWAGPSHWKIKFNRAPSSRFSGKTELQQIAKLTKRTRTKVYEEINFDFLEDYNSDIPQLNSKRKLPTTTVEKITLPMTDITFEQFHKITDESLCIPGLRFENKKSVNRCDLADIPAYNYENPNDSNYVAQNSMDEDDGDRDNEEIHVNHENNAGPENLLDVDFETPEMVTATQIHFSTHAKKMDMKKLKGTIWDMLSNKELDKIQPMQFSVLYHKLPQFLNNEMKKDLSVHLSFVALLHLCNEKELLLNQKDSTDFSINKA